MDTVSNNPRKSVKMFDIVKHWAKKQDDGEIDWFNNPMPHCVGCKWRCPFTKDKTMIMINKQVIFNEYAESIYESTTECKDMWEMSGTFLDKAHLIDHSLGGDSSPENLVPLCKRCHKTMSMTMFQTKEEAINWLKNMPLCHEAFQEYTDLCFCENKHERLFRVNDPRFISEYERLQSIVQKKSDWKLVWKTPEGDFIESIYDMENYKYEKILQNKLSNEDDVGRYTHIYFIVEDAIEDLEDPCLKSHTVIRYRKALKIISKTDHSLNIPSGVDSLTQKELIDIFINIGRQVQEKIKKKSL